MFTILELFGTVIEFIGYLLDWRFTVCVLISAAIAAVAVEAIPSVPVRCVVGLLIVLAGCIAGLRWERSSR